MKVGGGGGGTVGAMAAGRGDARIDDAANRSLQPAGHAQRGKSSARFPVPAAQFCTCNPTESDVHDTSLELLACA